MMPCAIHALHATMPAMKLNAHLNASTARMASGTTSRTRRPEPLN